MRFIYTLALYCIVVPASILRLLWRSVARPSYLESLHERFGFASRESRSNPGTDPGCQPVIWIHAVSVGETQAAVPLVEALRDGNPDSGGTLSLVFTNTTPTGRERARSAFGDRAVLRYFPFDIPGAIARFLEREQPRLVVLMETEIWPNLLYACAARNIHTALVNARLSERSARRYGRIPALIGPALRSLNLIAAQTAEDAERFIALGARPESVRVTGSLKFDQELPSNETQGAQDLRRSIAQGRAVMIAASTHEGEDELVLDAFAAVREQVAATMLLVAPRHPERAAAIVTLCKRAGWFVVLRSALKEGNFEWNAGSGFGSPDVVVVDTLGELMRFYGISDVAFVGGSLVPTGGHNPLEPAMLGVPVVLGPHTFNFGEISDGLVEAGAALRAANSAELAACVGALLGDPQRRAKLGARGKQFVADNRGAGMRTVALLSEFTGVPDPDPTQ